MDPQDILNRLVKADAAGDTEAARELKALYDQVMAQQQGPKDRGLGNAIRHGLQQGATFGFADEASAAARAGILDPVAGALAEIIPGGTDWETHMGDSTYGDRYRMYRGSERDEIAGGRKHHGGAMLAAEFVPGLLAGGAGALKSAGAVAPTTLKGLLIPKGTISAMRQGLEEAGTKTLRETVGRAMLTGAGYGGLAGAGYSEADTLGGVGKDALIGAGFGAGLGGVMPVAGSGVKRGFQNVGRRFGVSGAQEAAKSAARRQILKDLKREGLTPDEAATVIARLDPEGTSGVTLADIGREQGDLLKSVDFIVQQPGAGGIRMAEAYANRQIDAINRMRPALREGIEQSPLTSKGLKIPKQYSQIEDAIISQSKKLSDPLWDKAYPANVKLTPWLRQHLRGRVNKKGDFVYADKRIQAASKRADEMIANRISHNEIAPDDPTMGARYLDEIQRALRDKASASGAKARGSQASSRRVFHSDFVKQMKKVMPKEWKTARKIWAGRKANEEALEAGEKIFSGHIGKHETKLGKMKMSERDYYLVGALRAIEDRIMRKPDTGDLLRELRATARGNEVLKLLFGGEKGFLRVMNDTIKLEERLARTYRATKTGSATQGRFAKGQDLAEAGGTIAGLMLNIPGLPWLTRKLGGRAAQAFQRADEMKRDSMANLLLTRNPSQLTERLAKPPMPNAPLQQTFGLATATQLPGLLDE